MSIDSIEARLAKATEGPWEHGIDGNVDAAFPHSIYHPLREYTRVESGWGCYTPKTLVLALAYYPDKTNRGNLDFIARSRQDIPALLKVAKAAQEYIGAELADGPERRWKATMGLTNALAELEAME